MTSAVRPRRWLSRCSLWAALAALLSSSTGCSYLLFLGYLIGGPPTIEPDFDVQTKESLTDKDVSVVVVCFAPTDIRYSFENIDHEVAKFVSFRLIQHEIKVVAPDRVRAWLDENKEWDEPSEIGSYFKATHVVYIDLSEFSLYEGDSTNLFRGRAEAIVSVWKMEGENDAEKIYTNQKISKFPTHQPIASSDETYQNFKARYLARLSEEIGRLFYEYTMFDEIGESG
jgi:DNA gyrase/topoisomerase IV subunit B